MKVLETYRLHGGTPNCNDIINIIVKITVVKEDKVIEYRL